MDGCHEVLLYLLRFKIGLTIFSLRESMNNSEKLITLELLFVKGKSRVLFKN